MREARLDSGRSSGRRRVARYPASRCAATHPIAVDVGDERRAVRRCWTDSVTVRGRDRRAARRGGCVEPSARRAARRADAAAAIARLADTRGAAMTLARIDFETDTLSWIGIGNVTADLVAKTPERCPDPSVGACWPAASSVTASRIHWPRTRFRCAQATCSSSRPTASPKTIWTASTSPHRATTIAEQHSRRVQQGIR